jgi:arsenate reductase
MTEDHGIQRESYTPDIEYSLKMATSRLAREYEGRFNQETVERFVRDSFASLETSRVQSFVPIIAERFARDRLRALLKVESGTGSDVPHVLFLCVHNAGRSQMAAGWLKRLAGDRVAVYSGGSEPGDEVNSAAVEAMREVGIDISQEFPKPWTDEVVGAADVVVTMGCGDACPVFPGIRYVDWEVEDPAGQTVDAVRPIRDDLRRRVEHLMAELNVGATTAEAASGETS